jgi:CheY-like chemotaxis protein
VHEIRTVLLVDDDPDIRLIGELALAKVGGWQVVTASSGPEAVAVAGTACPDLVLLDMMMPGMDGMQTLRELRSHDGTAPIPVLFMTAKVLPSEIAAYRDAGAQGVIPKPFDPLALPDAIRRALAA